MVLQEQANNLDANDLSDGEIDQLLESANEESDERETRAEEMTRHMRQQSSHLINSGNVSRDLFPRAKPVGIAIHFL